MKLYIDNGRSRCKAAAVTAALLLCCSATAQTVDEAWAASPASQDTQWAQVNMAPVSPSNSGSSGNVTFYQASTSTKDSDGNYRTVAVCPGMSKLVSGGGVCPVQNNYAGRLIYSYPSANSWIVGCTTMGSAWVGCQ